MPFAFASSKTRGVTVYVWYATVGPIKLICSLKPFHHASSSHTINTILLMIGVSADTHKNLLCLLPHHTKLLQHSDWLGVDVGIILLMMSHVVVISLIMPVIHSPSVRVSRSPNHAPNHMTGTTKSKSTQFVEEKFQPFSFQNLCHDNDSGFGDLSCNSGLASIVGWIQPTADHEPIFVISLNDTQILGLIWNTHVAIYSGHVPNENVVNHTELANDALNASSSVST